VLLEVLSGLSLSLSLSRSTAGRLYKSLAISDSNIDSNNVDINGK
jgi:hypothetical protein